MHRSAAGTAAPEREAVARRCTASASDVGNRASPLRWPATAPGSCPGGRVHPAVQDTIGAARRLAARAGWPASRRASERRWADCPTSAAHRPTPPTASTARCPPGPSPRGTDVYFARGQYNPGIAGRRPAHRARARTRGTQRGASAGGTLPSTQPGDAIEQEAEAVPPTTSARRARDPAARACRSTRRPAGRSAVEARREHDPNPSDPFRGLYISDEARCGLTQASRSSGRDARLAEIARALGSTSSRRGAAVCAAPRS
jgi:hypothetical protein